MMEKLTVKKFLWKNWRPFWIRPIISIEFFLFFHLLLVFNRENTFFIIKIEKIVWTEEGSEKSKIFNSWTFQPRPPTLWDNKFFIRSVPHWGCFRSGRTGPIFLLWIIFSSIWDISPSKPKVTSWTASRSWKRAS